MLTLFSLSLEANEIHLSQYEDDVQDVLMDMAGDDTAVFSDIDDASAEQIDLGEYSTDIQALLLDMAGQDPAIL
jgi:hypothetical protein